MSTEAANTSGSGRGSGKTATSEVIGRIYGGTLTMSLETRDGLDRMRQRLLAPSAAGVRVVALDNVKSSASSGEIESLITADTIDGHRLHHGLATRPNSMTWLLTANGIGLSRDLAERAVVIKLGRPQSDDFTGWAATFVAENRPQIIADVLGVLKRGPISQINPEHNDRWRAWQDGVLRCNEGADELAALIIDRRGGIDQDADDWDEVRSIVEELAGLALGLQEAPVHLPSKVICSRFEHVTGQKLTGKAFASMLNRFQGVDDAGLLIRNRSNRHTRGFIWYGRGTLGGVQYFDWSHFNPAGMTPAPLRIEPRDT